MTRMSNSEAVDVIRLMYVDAVTHIDDEYTKAKYALALKQVGRMLTELRDMEDELCRRKENSNGEKES